MSTSTHIIQANQLLQEEHTLYDAGTERAFLACIQLQPNLIVEAERLVSTDAIFLPLNRYVYSVMLWIYQNASKHGFPILFDAMSMLAVSQYMGPTYHEMFMQKTDGLNHVRMIEALQPSVSPHRFPVYTSILLDRAARVAIYREGRRLQEAVMNLEGNPISTEIAVQASDSFGMIGFKSQAKSVDSRITQIGEADEEYFEKIELNKQHPGLFNTHIPSFPFLMSLMNGGYRRRGLAIICARPKVGKSTILLYKAIDSALRGIPTLYMDTEMSREEMYGRAISNVSDVREHDIMRGHRDKEQDFREAMMIARERCRGLPLYYINISGKPVHHITSVMRQFRNQYVGTQTLTAPNGKNYTFSNQALVIYDWLKLPDQGALGKNTAEFQMLGFQCSTIKDAAAELDLPVVAGAQNNRNAINFDSDDWMEMAEAAVGGSDRIAQFCTFLAVLRNVLPEEEEAIAEYFPWRTNEESAGSGRLAFNQFLHVYLQRGGSDYRRGIPLFLDRGKARYTEMAEAVLTPNEANPSKRQYPNTEKMKLIDVLRKLKLKLPKTTVGKTIADPGAGKGLDATAKPLELAATDKENS